MSRDRLVGRAMLYTWTCLMLSCSQEGKVQEKASFTPKKVHSTWEHYLGDPHRSHFASFSQLDTSNVSQLEVAWTYQSGGLTEGRNSQIQANPLIIGGQLISVNAANHLFAIDNQTGERLWEFVPSSTDQSGLGLSRGLSFWRAPSEDEPSRVFYASGPLLYAVDVATGEPVSSFGENGHIDLRENLDRDPEKLTVVLTTPGTIFKNLLIVGSRTSESPGAAPGYIRAYDVQSGELVWTFKTIPGPGEYGYDTWPEDAYQNKNIGGANCWAGMALDEENGIIYAPTGSAAFDWYGGDRIGNNLFANTLLALNAETGERIWHFQVVKHDLWDRDLPAPPNLLDVYQDGKKIPAIAQVTKSGHVFVLNRLTGESLFPLEAKTYPQTTLAGDVSATTQVLPTIPAPFARQSLSEGDLYAPDQPAFVDDFIDKQQNNRPLTVREKLAEITSEGQFIPIDTAGVILYPGADGGAEWGGAAVDPRSGVMYVNSNEMAWIVKMSKVGADNGKPVSRGASLAQIHCARCHGGNLQGLGAIPNLQHLEKTHTPDQIHSVLLHGKGAMPAMPNLEEDEIEAITDYLLKTESKLGDHRAATDFDTPYAISGFGRFKDNRGFPVVSPPWGTLNAIDLNTGEYLWKIPLGHDERLNDPAHPVSGTENYGGPVITESGVLFIAATHDEKIRAFSMKSGKKLWEADLPAGGYATPATYMSGGKQYIVIACGGGKMGTPSGDRYLAFALP